MTRNGGRILRCCAVLTVPSGFSGVCLARHSRFLVVFSFRHVLSIIFAIARLRRFLSKSFCYAVGCSRINSFVMPLSISEDASRPVHAELFPGKELHFRVSQGKILVD